MKPCYLLISTSSFCCNETDGASKYSTCRSERFQSRFNNRPARTYRTSILTEKLYYRIIVIIDTTSPAVCANMSYFKKTFSQVILGQRADCTPLILMCLPGNKPYPALTTTYMKRKQCGDRSACCCLAQLNQKYTSDTCRVK